ncbi:92_t:CDS:2, partial [Funneliformis mosseae]
NLKLLRSGNDRRKKGKLALQYYKLFNTYFWDSSRDEYDVEFQINKQVREQKDS